MPNHCAHIADYYFDKQKQTYSDLKYEDWSNEYDLWLTYLIASTP